MKRVMRDIPKGRGRARICKLPSGWPTYSANLCLVFWDVEFAGKREDFGKPIGTAVEIASHRTVWQSAEHFHDMSCCVVRVKDAVEIGASRGKDHSPYLAW